MFVPTTLAQSKYIILIDIITNNKSATKNYLVVRKQILGLIFKRYKAPPPIRFFCFCSMVPVFHRVQHFYY